MAYCPKRTRAPRLRGPREAGVTGLEPAASGLTVLRSNQLSYTPRHSSERWAVTDLNRRPPACKAGALPTELTAPSGRGTVAGLRRLLAVECVGLEQVR